MRWQTRVELLRFALWLQFFAPRPSDPNTVSLFKRLSQFPTSNLPLERPMKISWSDQAVPFIEAECDRDIPVGLGLVHAHLRLGQMEMLRRVSQGRISEMVGAAALDLDHLIRAIDFGRPVADMIEQLSDQTRRWLDGFVTGINHVLHNAPLPHEFELFDLKREPWHLRDVLTLARLYAFDNNWLVWLGLLGIQQKPHWPALWNRLMAHGQDGAFDPRHIAMDSLHAAFDGINNRAGSNSFAVSAQLAGKTWIASDPHLGLSLPSNWLLAGYKSPGHNAVGLMIPAMPVIAIGCNADIAWGGTSLHALASELCDVSSRDLGQFKSREAVIKVRWARPKKLTTTLSPVGPILPLSRLLTNGQDNLALHWLGHRPSDEIGAYLRVSTARNWNEFRAALEGFAVPGLNMIYADRRDHIGHALAAWIPSGLKAHAEDIVTKDPKDWSSILTSDALPAILDPERGYVVSANDRPDTPIVVGRFFSPRARTKRISSQLEVSKTVSLSTLSALQQDVKSDSALQIAHLLTTAVSQHAGIIPSRAAQLLAMVRNWDGIYDTSSRGAAGFERWLSAFAKKHYHRDVLLAYTSAWALREMVLVDLQNSAPRHYASAARNALIASSRRWRRERWGQLHRVVLQHPLGSIPLAGKPYRFWEGEAAGSSDTVMKTSSGLTGKSHAVRFGSNARHISDLSDQDQNFFVILGGQDGWLGSANFSDQVPLWGRGDYLQLPLRPASVAKLFPHVTHLEP